jgi:hypothetical protein
VILSITPYPPAPCAGTDVLITVQATDGTCVANVTIEYGGSSYTMSGPDGSISGNWTYTIPGMPAGEVVEYTVTATDSLGNSVTSNVHGIFWSDCTAPVILSITPYPPAPCAGTDVLITVHATAGIGVNVANVTIEYGASSYTMSGPDGSNSGDWNYTISGSGRSAGEVVEYTVTATDSSGNSVVSNVYGISWSDCTAPVILSITPFPAAPCANEDVTIIARIEDDNVVTSVSLVIDNTPYDMSPGPNAGNYSYLIHGRGDREAVSYYVYAEDGYGNEATSNTFTLSWKNCPKISEISPGDNETCEGNDLEITAKIEPSTDIVWARIIYEEIGVAGSYQLEMTRTEDPEIWSGIISGRRVRTINYSIIASTERNSVSSESHNITWLECDEPEIIDQHISNPCAETDAQVSITIRDVDRDFYLATITYEGNEYPLVLQGSEPYPVDGIWNGSIPGAGRQAGEILDVFVKGYTLDTPGPNPPEGLGQFNVEWIDCRPSISEVSPGSTEVCTGIDHIVSARAISPSGISSMTLYYNDSTGQYETSTPGLK